MTLPMKICRYLLVLLVTFLTTFCAVESQDGGNLSKYPQTALSEGNPSKDRYVQYLTHPPKITLAPTDKKVVENGVVSFFCKASGNPSPDIHWRKGGKSIPRQLRYMIEPMPEGTVLRIEPVLLKDNRVFECVAENGVGNAANATAKLEVYPEGQVPDGYPRITEGPTLKAVEKGRNTTMFCSAIGTPEPIISWLKDYVPVDTTDPRLLLLPTGSLQITQSLETDEGRYECVAENSAGVVYSHAANLYVRVRRVPPYFSIPPESVEVMPGGAVNLTCVAKGSPMPHVEWHLGYLELTTEDNIPIGENVLRLSDIRESAIYTCVATSELGNIEADAEVRVKATPRAPIGLVASEVGATSVTLRWNVTGEEPVDSYVIQYRRKYIPGEGYSEITDVTQTEHTILGLNAFTAYEVRVIAVNNIGRGLPSYQFEVHTLEMLPGGAPSNFTAIGVSSTSVRLEWDPPSKTHRNGEIVLYEISYHNKFEPNADRAMNTTEMSIMVEGLETMTEYTFRIRAYTSVGAGPWSNPLPFRTFPYSILPGPSNVKVIRTSPTALQVTWDPPQYRDVVGYRVYYNRYAVEDMEAWPSVDIAPFTVQELTGLEPNSVYAVRIRARFSGERYSDYSTVAISNATKKVPGGAPSNFTAIVVSSTNVRLKWDPPSKTHRNGEIVFYEISGHKKFEPNVDWATNTTGRSITVKGLQATTEYIFQIRAFTSAGAGPWSNRLPFRTFSHYLRTGQYSKKFSM